VAGQANGGGMINGINVTPLVDVMLVLLIIFMVTAKLVVAPSTALGVQLPKAASGDAIQAVFSIQLTKQGGIFADGRALTGMRRSARRQSGSLRRIRTCAPSSRQTETCRTGGSST
jgi:biopolymer transport protein ExbD